MLSLKYCSILLLFLYFENIIKKGKRKHDINKNFKPAKEQNKSMIFINIIIHFNIIARQEHQKFQTIKHILYSFVDV